MSNPFLDELEQQLRTAAPRPRRHLILSGVGVGLLLVAALALSHGSTDDSEEPQALVVGSAGEEATTLTSEELPATSMAVTASSAPAALPSSQASTSASTTTPPASESVLPPSPTPPPSSVSRTTSTTLPPVPNPTNENKWTPAWQVPTRVNDFVSDKLEGTPGLLLTPTTEYAWATESGEVNVYGDTINLLIWATVPHQDPAGALLVIETRPSAEPVSCTGGGVTWTDIELRGQRACAAGEPGAVNFIKWQEAGHSVLVQIRPYESPQAIRQYLTEFTQGLL